MKAVSLLHALTFVSLVVGMLSIQSCDRAPEGGRKELKLPDQSDPRFAVLATMIPRQVIANESISDFVNRVELAKLMKSPVILRGELDGRVINISFDGGTLKELLEDVSSDAHISFLFENYCVAIQPE